MAKPNKIKNQPRPIRLYTYVNEDEERQIKEAADLADLRVSVFLRKLALAQQIRPAKSRQAQELIATLNKLGADLNRTGNNLNQIAHQVNAAGFDPRKIDHLEDTLKNVKEAVQSIIVEIKKV